MDRQSVRQRFRSAHITCSTALQLRYERDRLELQKRVTEQLVSDVFGLYEKSLFVDLKLEALRGNVYCHQFFFAARVPAVWHLLREISKFQHPIGGPSENLFSIQLPNIDCQELQKFIRTLYSDKANRAAGVEIRRKLEDTLAIHQQRALINHKKLRIERLSTEEEQHVQKLILEQLRLGHLSERRGNVQDLKRFIRPSDSRCLCHKNAVSDSDSSTCNTVTLKPRIRGHSPNTSKSVRAKSSQRIHAQLPNPLGNTMNIADPSVVNIGNCETSEKQQIVENREACGDICDNSLGDNVSSSKSGKKGKVFKGPSTTRRSCSDDLSPVGQLSKQEESPVFNVSMIKELQTSPMQVSGELFQNKLREKRDCSPSKTHRSSNSESNPVESFIKEFEQRSGRACVNGESSPFYLESVKTKAKLHKYGAMSSTKENASLHQAAAPVKHPVPAQSASTSKSYQQRKSQSFGAESQDSGDFDTTSVSNSGSDHRLSHLHETSSLEVELPSSHDENSSSRDSDESPVAPSQCRILNSNSNDLDKADGNNIAAEDDTGSPKRPLVRARTFEVFHPLIDGASSDSQVTHPKQEKSKINNDEKPEAGMSSRTVSTHHVSFNARKCEDTPKEQNNSIDNGKERKISDESVSLYQENLEDPEKLREIERKKGSLLFEHNFQTYSNIPTTNMMTASMMTASISSESSMGVTSLYSSMMDSAMLGSIHSLGGLDAPVVDPIPRPASVGLPIIHTLEEPSCGPHVVGNHPPVKDQKSTEEMALELQQEIAQRGQGTRSPSPDSLSVDFAAKRELETVQRQRSSEIPSKEMETSTSSINKEEMDNEEKERDERENESKSSESSNSEAKGETKVDVGKESLYSSLSNITGSPRLARTVSENTPIVSGGSTLKREKEVSDAVSIPKCDRQVSVGSVKDVDSIPLVFGYIGPQDEDDDDDEKKEKKEKEPSAGGGGDDDDKQPQSIFPMFIDFNELPTPTTAHAIEEEKRLAAKAKAQSSGVYMYIEADTPSPKSRRKRKSESDGALVAQFAESHPEGECSSLPPVLPDATKHSKDENPKSVSKEEENSGGSDEGANKEKKGFFMFIEAETSSKTSSPKPRRRQVPLPKKKPEVANVMTRSAPSDSILFSSPDSSSKMMTKSVIDRDEFIAQPPTRKNVSLNDRINESSNSKDSSFVSGIPRPIHSLKSKSPIPKASKVKASPQRRDASSHRDNSVSKTKDEQPSETNDMATSRDISISELGPSQSISLSEVMSTSLPRETEASEVSDVSSLLSSIDRSNEPSEQGGTEPCSRLGEDLLRMFLNEINTDVTIQIGEKRIRAHKCILASRCVYFAAMLSGHWVESAGNVIKLQGFSADSVMVALKHIYSGSSTVPEGVRVGELAALADMLALDGLKDVISLHLKAKMCHYFHKPCSGCLEGVLDVLPIAGAYCLDEIYHRCLRWVAKHFVVVLPTRNYAALPPEVQDRCLKQLLDDMSVSNVIDTALGCERVLSSLPMVRWAQPVFDSAAQLLESATSFIATNLSGVLASDRFLALGKDSGWGIDSLEDTMRVACELIRPDQAVLSHVQLTKLLEQNQEDSLSEVSESFLSFLENLLNQVEKFMIHNANRVAVCRKWPMLSTSTQRRIKDAALVVVEFSRPMGSRPRLSSGGRRPRGSSSDGTGTPGRGDQRLMRSASATAVPSSQRTTPRRPPLSGQNPARCQTPPANLSRLRTQTPPPTRASTLRAQARQAAIQRSQSARTVAERPCRPKQGNDTSTDEDTQSSGKRTAPVGTFTRGATFTRSLSRPGPGCPRPHTPTRAPAPSSSRPRTPAASESVQPPKRAAPLQRTSSHTTTGSSASEDEIPNRKCNTAPRGRTLSSLNEGLGDGSKFARTQSTELRSRTPTRRPEARSSVTSNLRPGRGQREFQSSNPNLSEGGSHTPRTPKADKGEPRRQVDVKNGNVVARSRSAAMGRRATRSPMRETGRTTALATGRGTSPTPSHTLTSSATELRSRSCSVSNRTVGSTATPPSVGSRSNTFSKDGTASNKKPFIP